MTVNWRELRMVFWVGNRRVTIRGDPSLAKTLVSCKTMFRTLQQENQGFIVQLQLTEAAPEVPPRASSAVKVLISEFAEVFNMPAGLPPQRIHQHAIVLRDGNTLISIHPYRYPTHKKMKLSDCRSLTEHWEHLATVLEVIRRNKLYANQKKCSFAQQQIEYLGHIVSGDGVSADPAKIEAMLSWPIPKNLRELRGFLGLTGYYRKFVEGYGKIAWPLTEQLKKDNFTWTDAATEAFRQLQSVMTRVPVLRCLISLKTLYLRPMHRDIDWGRY